jgi:hypothetical protein
MTSWSQGNSFTAAPGLPFEKINIEKIKTNLVDMTDLDC